MRIRALPRWLLVFTLSFLRVVPAYSDIVTQESFKTHLRWNLLLSKEQITISKKENVVLIETLNLPLFESLSADLGKMKKAEGYIEGLRFSQDGFPSKPARIEVTLKDMGVELFSFYRDLDNKWIMDFWINSDVQPQAISSASKISSEKTVDETKKVVMSKPTPPARPAIPLELKSPKKSLLEVIEVAGTTNVKKDQQYRDFRYGAAFIWDYSPLLPPLERDIQLESKIPESLYPIKDRELLDDPKEAHLQLTINLYHQEKWGLMNKSQTLYQKKYGDDANFDANEWIRINSLMRSNITKKDRTLQATAMNLLNNLLERTQNYELKRAAFRFLLQYQIDRGDYFKSLEMAKQFFVEARGQFDFDMVVLASNVILNSLARLRQTDKIEEFLADKKLAALLPAQTELAYASFSLLAAGKTGELIKRFQKQEKSLAKPVHPAILYNVAEAYFREAQYSEAGTIYDAFVAQWAHLREAAAARLRLALVYELTGKPASETLVLYKNAIDRSPYPEFRYEAKLRYVGLRVARKILPGPADVETEVFLEQADDEKKIITQDMKRLLWLVRLRTYLSRSSYEEALAYLSSIPIDTLKPAERRVFEGDGAEIVFGLIQQSYLKEDYTRTVKVWEVYKDRFDKRVAANPYMHFIVADCFIKLGLYQSFERAYAVLKGMGEQEAREFPLWVERSEELPLKDILEELDLIKAVSAKEWDQAEAKLTSYPVSLRDSVNFSYYAGLVAYGQGQWGRASESFEKVLLKQNEKNRLTPRQMSELLMGYVESLYNLKDHERFKTVIKALAVDIQRSKSASILNVAERVNYLLIESLVGESTPDWKEIERQLEGFRGKFQKSPYSSRIEYLLGLSLLRNGKMDEGKKTLRSLIEKKEVPVYVREMAKTELSALELKEKRL